jgi:hypothetical protein
LKQGRVTFVEKGRNREIGFIEESLSNPEAARFLKISEERVERLERLERLERVAVLGRVESERNKEIYFTGKVLPLATCLPMIRAARVCICRRLSVN